MVEMERINQKLSKEGNPINLTVLKRAMMIPDELEVQPGHREYPDPGLNLMPNPFPKPKKKKKKGKK